MLCPNILGKYSKQVAVILLTGYYAVDGKDNLPCFVYATFNNKIYIYYNICLPRVESTNLIEVMDKFEETHELLAKLNIHCKYLSSI